jgi:hypothetical protein
MSRTRIVNVFALMMAAGFASAVALAQPQNAPGGPNDLGGPKVDPQRIPGQRDTFAPRDRRPVAGQEIPGRAFQRILNEALGEKAPEAVRATPEQTEKFKAVTQEFEASVRAYQEQHREELQRLRAAGIGGEQRPARRETDGDKGGPRDGRPAGDPMMSDEERNKLAERAREIRENAPKASDVQTKIWAMLREDQQKAVQVGIDKFRADEQKRRDEDYLRRRAGKDGGKEAPGRPEGRPENAPPADPEAMRTALADLPQEQREAIERRLNEMPPERRDALLRRLQDMTPEQREQALNRLREGRGGRPAGPGGPEGNPERRRGRPDMPPPPGDKPAPRGRDVPPPPQPE